MLESRGASWLSREGAGRPGLHPTARTRAGAAAGFAGAHFPDTPVDHLITDLVIVTGRLQCRAYKMVTSLMQVFLINLLGLMYLAAPCLIGVKFGGLNPVSFIRLIASSPLTRGQGSHSHPIIGAHSLGGSLPCSEMSKPWRNLGPFTRQILACLGGLNVTRHGSGLKSFRHLQLMINCE